MYPNYNMVENYPNMYPNNQIFFQNQLNQDERFFPGGFIAPLLLGGVAGYLIGERPNNYPYPYPYPYNYYYNNFYYPPYYNNYY